MCQRFFKLAALLVIFVLQNSDFFSNQIGMYNIIHVPTENSYLTI